MAIMASAVEDECADSDDSDLVIFGTSIDDNAAEHISVVKAAAKNAMAITPMLDSSCVPR